MSAVKRGSATPARGRGRGGAKRSREDDGAVTGGDGGTVPDTGMAVKAGGDSVAKDAFLSLLGRHPEGLTIEQIEASGIENVDRAMNAALAERAVGVFNQKDALGNVTQLFRLVSGEQQLAGLTQEEALVHQEITKAGNKGIWSRTLKMQTGLAKAELDRAIKHLTSQKLIKQVKSVLQKTKTIYMLAELEPSRELTGGPWYTEDQEMDLEFVEGIRLYVLNALKTGPKTCKELAEIAAVGAWSKDDPLADTDLRSIMHTLRYDGFVEEARSGGGRAVDPADPPYRLIGQPSSVTPLATVPCGSCPVSDKCTPGGVISPTTCVYLDGWLDF